MNPTTFLTSGIRDALGVPEPPRSRNVRIPVCPKANVAGTDIPKIDLVLVDAMPECGAPSCDLTNCRGLHIVLSHSSDNPSFDFESFDDVISPPKAGRLITIAPDKLIRELIEITGFDAIGVVAERTRDEIQRWYFWVTEGGTHPVDDDSSGWGIPG